MHSAMEPRLSVVTLGVADLAASLKFYEGLGWRRANTGAEIVFFFQLNGMVLSLFPWAHLAKDATVSQDGMGFRGITLAYCTRTRDDVDAVMASAEAAGGHIVKVARNAFWGGYSGYFADPDGHLWEVAWNPNWHITEHGDVQVQ